MVKMIDPAPGMQWAADVMTGQREFPTFNKADKSEPEGFKDIFDRELAKIAEKRNEGRKDYNLQGNNGHRN